MSKMLSLSSDMYLIEEWNYRMCLKNGLISIFIFLSLSNFCFTAAVAKNLDRSVQSSAPSKLPAKGESYFIAPSQIYYAVDKLLPQRVLREDLGEKLLPQEQRIFWDTMDLFLQRQLVRRQEYNQDHPQKKANVYRIFHTKSHGCVRAKFWANEDTPDYLRKSFIQTALDNNNNDEQGYDTLIRFSNSKDLKPQNNSDMINGRRGIAIKIFDLAEELENFDVGYQNRPTLDLNLVNAETFFLKDAVENLVFSKVFFSSSTGEIGLSEVKQLIFGKEMHPDALEKSGLSKYWWSNKKLLNSIATRAKEAMQLRKELTDIYNPLQAQYWSNIPFALGDEKDPNSVAVKLTAVACDGPEYQKPDSENAIRSALYEHLESGKDGCFDLRLQVLDVAKSRKRDRWKQFGNDLLDRFSSEKSESLQNQFVEDGMKLWDEDKFPFISVGKIIVPAQSEDAALNQQCERTGFNLGSMPKDFQPLGSLGRVRRVAYLVTQLQRYFTILKSAELQAEAQGMEKSLVDLKAEFGKIMSDKVIDLYIASKPVIQNPIQKPLIYPDINWQEDTKNVLSSIYQGAKARDILSHNNLFSLIDFTELRAYDCDAPEKQKYRTYNGSCNDLDYTSAGAASTPLGTNTDPLLLIEGQTVMQKKNLPSPFEVSKRLLMREEADKPLQAENVNLFLGTWLQFMVHDWFNHKDSKRGKSVHAKEVEIHGDNDAGFPWKYESLEPAVNEITHWWDASQVYGSSKQGALSLRTAEGKGAYLHMENGMLPLEQRRGMEKAATGFNNNWWLGLEFLHTLFAKEHNYVVSKLAKRAGIEKKPLESPQTETQIKQAEDLYQKARLIVAALTVKIQTVEWTPILLNNLNARVALNANYCGLQKTLLDPRNWKKETHLICSSEKHKESSGELVSELVSLGLKPEAHDSEFDYEAKIDHLINGIMGSEYTQNYNVPFSMTEEFVSVYRAHQLLLDEFDLYQIGEKDAVEKVGLLESLNKDSHDLLKKYGGHNVAYSIGKNKSGTLRLKNFPKTLANFPLPAFRQRSGNAPANIDLGAVEIMRDRKRLPIGFNGMRKSLGLRPYRSFYELLPERWEAGVDKNKEIRDELMEVYNGDIDAIDLLVGLVAEDNRPPGFLISQTAFRVFLFMTPRRSMTDRFYTKDYRPEIYTQWGLDHISNTGLKNILMRHHPELRSVLKKVNNPFELWD